MQHEVKTRAGDFREPQLPEIPDRVFDIRDFGAEPGETALQTIAIATAIAAASAAGGGRVVVPPGTWLTGPIHMKSRVALHIEAGATVRFSTLPEDYLPVVLSQRGGIMLYGYSPFLYAYACHDIAVTGGGTLDGQGAAWWPWKEKQPGMKTVLVDIPEQGIPLEDRVFGTREAGVRPVFCQFIECDRVLIEDVRFQNSPSWTLQPIWCRELTIRRVTVFNPPSPQSRNTDGIDPDACRNVLVEHCHVSTGDDAICLKAGLGQDAWKDGRPCENVCIRHCRIGTGHGGITIGSDMSGGVRNVYVHDCELDGTDRGIRIKSKPGRGGFVENVRIEHIRMRNMRSHAIDINLVYDGNIEETLDLERLEHVPRFEDIVIRDVRCESAVHPIRLQGLPGYPVQRVALENIHIASGGKSCIRDVEGLRQHNVVVEKS